MTAFFFTGDKDQMFKELGIPYGFIAVEGSKQMRVSTISDGKEILDGAVKDNTITKDEAKKAEAAMTKAGLLPGVAEIFQKAGAFTLPKGTSTPFKFQPCANSECHLPYRHGQILNEKGVPVTDTIHSLETGWGYCSGGVSAGAFKAPEAIAVFQQMMKADLPLDEATAEKLFSDSIPEEERRRLAQEVRAISTVINTPLGQCNLITLELPLPPEIMALLLRPRK